MKKVWGMGGTPPILSGRVGVLRTHPRRAVGVPPWRIREAFREDS